MATFSHSLPAPALLVVEDGVQTTAPMRANLTGTAMLPSAALVSLNHAPSSAMVCTHLDSQGR